MTADDKGIPIKSDFVDDSGELRQIQPPLGGGITFLVRPNREVLRIEPNGDFFVSGERVETSEEVRDVFAAWVMHSTGVPSPEVAALRAAADAAMEALSKMPITVEGAAAYEALRQARGVPRG